MVEAQEHWALQQQCLCGEWVIGKAGNRQFISRFKKNGSLSQSPKNPRKTEPTKYVTTLRSEKDETEMSNYRYHNSITSIIYCKIHFACE